MRLNSLKMSKHLRGVRAVPGHDNISLSALHTVGQTGDGNLRNKRVTFSLKCFGLSFVFRFHSFLLGFVLV